MTLYLRRVGSSRRSIGKSLCACMSDLNWNFSLPIVILTLSTDTILIFPYPVPFYWTEDLKIFSSEADNTLPAGNRAELKDQQSVPDDFSCAGVKTSWPSILWSPNQFQSFDSKCCVRLMMTCNRLLLSLFLEFRSIYVQALFIAICGHACCAANSSISLIQAKGFC